MDPRVDSEGDSDSEPQQLLSTGIGVETMEDIPAPKAVLAHFMVGNTYSYTDSEWINDIELAHSHGIDGFILNVGRDPWQPLQIASAFKAVSLFRFRLCLSFDMTSLVSQSQSDITTLKEYIEAFGNHPNYFRYHGKPFVTTFGGEYATFGLDSPTSGWKSVLSQLPHTIHFVPTFFVMNHVDRSVLDGDCNWDGAWPMGDSPISFDSDRQRVVANQGKTYMATVSPCFFTHYGPDSWNKNFIYRGDDWLYNSRWEMLVQHRSQIDIVEIISWNDYGESHYIGPIRKDQPNSQAWVNGFDHQAWLEMTSYYASAFKTGHYPRIQKDQLYIWARPHAAAASAHDAVPKPKNTNWTRDILWAAVFTTAPAEVTLVSGSRTWSTAVGTGVFKVGLGSLPGHQTAFLSRGTSRVVSIPSNAFSFTLSPQTYNYNYYVARGSGHENELLSLEAK
ncbi:glycoside hydrolase family 71 protein [Sphaerobolus stellatus SS14]|uniref:Glycoside hydrolase family 71 protein n=1 Tax=Sphaerobolus stellatus (strain SS14) TaxID=990650 RepID=A0A0C9TBC1_SPHS4|nr:glycoside hydrolase family 71 protein [Sphaerobolus stellatus SS14]KIJ29062.1 glycoside hydrolase family 71 protein [Sphaerobolus stellatus SS14]